ncbi:MAG: hypothetical protein AAB443_02635 [Patescibacteria group bacterium]
MISSKVKLTKIEQELILLKSFIIGLAGKDNEGAYRQEFVKKTLESLSETPKREFSDSKSFLRQISESK